VAASRNEQCITGAAIRRFKTRFPPWWLPLRLVVCSDVMVSTINSVTITMFTRSCVDKPGWAGFAFASTGILRKQVMCWDTPQNVGNLAFRGKTSKIERDSTKWDSIVWWASREKSGIIGSDWRVGKNREKSVIIGIPIFPNNSW
jgi:hypothetical protein